jgi:hypothetical protein
MNEKQMLTGLGLLMLAGFLLSRPRCNRGCRTVAQHLIEHGLDDFLGGLLVA